MTLGEKEPVQVVDDLEALSSEEKQFLDDIDGSAYDVYRLPAGRQLEGNVLEEAEDTVLLGDITKAAREGSVLYRAGNTHLHGDVSGEHCGHVLLKAEDSTIRGDISVWKSVLNESRDSHVYGDVETSYGVLNRAEGSSITGDVQAARHVMQGAEQSSIHGDVETSDFVMVNATDSVIEGDVEAGLRVLSSATGSIIRGDVEARGEVAQKAEDCMIRGNITASGRLLNKAERSLVIGESIKTREWTGSQSSGCILACKEEAGYNPPPDIEYAISSSLEVIMPEMAESQSRETEALTYRGDWEELEDGLEQWFHENGLASLQAFQLEKDEVEDWAELRQHLDEIDAMYNEIQDDYELYQDVKDDLYLDDIEGTNEQRFELLQDIKATVRQEMEERYSLSPDSADAMIRSENRSYLVDNADEIEQAGGLDTFIREFHGGSDRYVAQPGFSEERRIAATGEKKVVDADQQEMNQQLYDDGVELLDQIMEGRGKFEIEDETYEEKLEERAAVEEQIDEAFRDGEEEKGRELIERKRSIEADLHRIGDEYKQQAFDRLGLTDRDSLGLDQLQEGLNQLWQEYLEPCPAQEEARRIAESIELGADEIGSNTVAATVWDKDIETLPWYKDYSCCIFAGGIRDKHLIQQMKDPNVQFLRIRAGDNEAMAITTQAYNPETGDDYLLVNSVESGSNVLKREPVAQAVDQTIQAYAAELDMDAVLYNDAAHNTAPNQFLDNLDYGTEHLKIEKDGATSIDTRGKSWLESELGRATYICTS